MHVNSSEKDDEVYYLLLISVTYVKYKFRILSKKMITTERAFSLFLL